MAYTIDINGKKRTVDVPPEMPLLWVLRDELDMRGTKFGCGRGLCGARTVHIDGKARRSCQTPIAQVGTAKVVTIEQIGNTPVGKRLQEAWVQVDVMQCGYCQAGQIMSAAALLEQSPQPSRPQITTAMTGNICRCACYNRIQEAIEIAAGMKDAANVA